MSNILGLLTPLPFPAEKLNGMPQIPSKTIAIFADDNWSSQRLDICLENYINNERHRIPDSMTDRATYIAFNLPVGTVVTMTDDQSSLRDGKGVADLGQCGRCVDLVGTGETVAVDLDRVAMQDCLSGFFWREVSLDMGAIEFFDDENFQGNRATIFLSEWESGQTYSIADWYLQDRISSVRWKSLNDRQKAKLFDNHDGTGDVYSGIIGWGASKEVASLSSIGFSDKVSGFRWESLVPRYEIIAPVIISGSDIQGDILSFTSSPKGTNLGPIPQKETVSLEKTESIVLTASTTDQNVWTTKCTVEVSKKAGVFGLADASFKASLTFGYERTESKTRTTTTENRVAVSDSKEISIPPRCSWEATLSASVGLLPEKIYHTTAERWYEIQVTGSTIDRTRENLYKRVEPVSVKLGGGILLDSRFDFNSTPMPD
jgi:hypothetical protein